MLLLCVFAVGRRDTDSFLVRAGRAVELLSEQSGCAWAEVGRAVDDPERWTLTARFDSVTAYRRSLSPFAVREHVAPLLAECLTTVPSTYEVVRHGTEGTVQEWDGLLAPDADTVARGESGPENPVAPAG